jgi:type III pantothenate kinase
MSNRIPIIAVDVGNSRIKLGSFDRPLAAAALPVPSHVLEVVTSEFNPAQLQQWLAETGDESQWWIASVNRPLTERLIEWLNERRVERHRLLCHTDLPLTVQLAAPDRVGIDRLLGAVAANHLRDPGRAAIVIDLGSAMTVDLISAQGAFLGGAILPGIGMSARALADFTDLLPRIAMEELAEPPPALGTSTVEAMRSGLYWGAVGAMKELITQLTKTLNTTPDIFLTGGAAPIVAQFIGAKAKHIPHLVLGGIALVADA